MIRERQEHRCSTCGAKIPAGAKACRWQSNHEDHAKRKVERKKRKAASRKLRADGQLPRRRLKS